MTPGLTVLIVDDMPSVANLLASLVQGRGHVPHVAFNGPDALAIARQHPPDVALLDIGLPGMDGCEVAKRLNEQAGERRPFLVAITGFGEENDRQRSAAAGIDLHMLKPVDPDQLSKLLDRFAQILHPPDVPTP